MEWKNYSREPGARSTAVCLTPGTRFNAATKPVLDITRVVPQARLPEKSPFCTLIRGSLDFRQLKGGDRGEVLGQDRALSREKLQFPRNTPLTDVGDDDSFTPDLSLG